MPPKIYKKAARESQPSRSSSQQQADKKLQSQKWDINLRFIGENASTMQRIHTLTSILAGVIAGLFNAGLYSGIFVYIALHLFVTLLVVSALKGGVQDYFMKKTELLGGLGAGVMVFLCGWIITYNVVYTL